MASSNLLVLQLHEGKWEWAHFKARVPESWNSKCDIHLTTAGKMERVERHLRRRLTDGLKNKDKRLNSCLQFLKHVIQAA